jgi:hypothetical protein
MHRPTDACCLLQEGLRWTPTTTRLPRWPVGAISLFDAAAISAPALFFTQFVQVVKGWSPLPTGLFTVLTAAAMTVGSMLAP